MTALTGPALLRAAADRLNQMDHAATKGPWRIDTSPTGRLYGAEPHTVVAFDLGDQDLRFIATLSALAPDLAAWLCAFSYEAEGLGWVNADGTWRLGSPTNYATWIAQKVMEQ